MQINSFLSLGVYVFGAVAVVLVMLGSYFLGQRHHDRATNAPFESGIKVTDSARVRFPVHFYVIAMIFVVFDLESVFLYLWAVDVQELGVVGLTQACSFAAVLMLGLIYLWRLGAFSIGPRLRKPRDINEHT
jgi:NADH-quinone oxidoreductase subunit A